MGNAYDALLGRVLSSAVELEIRGGLNFTGGLVAVADSDNNRNDVKPNFLRVLALGNLELSSGASTDLAFETYSELSGTFAAGAWNATAWEAETDKAGMTWAGTESCYVLAVATLTFTAGASKTLAFRWAINGTPVNAPLFVTPSSTNPISCTAVGLLYVDPSDVVSLMASNQTDSSDATTLYLQMALAAIGEAL